MNFITNDAQADQIHAHESGTFIEVIEQPPDGYELDYEDYVDFEEVVWFYNKRDNIYKNISTPHPSGTYDVMERWDWLTYRGDDNELIAYVIYKADNISDWDNWNSALTCPKSRYQVEVKTTVKRVQNLTYNEFVSSHLIGLTGFVDAVSIQPFIDLWNSEHAKPRLTKDKTAYECFPYDKLSFAETYCEDNRWNKGEVLRDRLPNTWKGKPLIINVNPYVAAMDWRRIIK